jgi:hypothetical protein
VKFSFSSEQEEFRSNLRRLLADRSPPKEVRRLMETDQGYERDGWRAINTALGLTAIRIPEAYGGHGFGFGDQCIVLEEMGRALLCAPYFATAVLAAGAVMNAGTEAEKQALLPGIAAGETTGHRQLEIRISIESALGWSCSAIRIDYAAMATPVMSVQVAKARVRPDRMVAAVSWSRRRGKRLAIWSWMERKR